MESFIPRDTIEKRIVNKAAFLRLPVSGSLELSPLCNMNCDMCYVRLGRTEQERLSPLITVDGWINIAEQIKEAGCVFLLLTGGEPFLYPGFRTLYEKLNGMGFALTINTNGTLIDEETAAWLGAYRPRRVNITLYGADEETYTSLCHYPGGFEAALRGIRLLREHNVDVKVNCSMVKKNATQLDEIMDICERLEVPVTIDSYMFPARRERQVWHADSRLSPQEAAGCWYRVKKRQMPAEAFEQFCQWADACTGDNFPGMEGEHVMSCRAGVNSFFITWQGLMKPCVFLPEPAVSLSDIPVSEAWKQITEAVAGIRMYEGCQTCDNRPLCGVCPASAYWEAGSYGAVPEYQCAFVGEAAKLMRAECRSK